ncbi:flagellar motor protein MotB [Helicobacter sp. 12S02634-8]|uniref:flagellar motor protein MotB n=1 Tax=Helicobacter sp. 12S02634-8 TaxID=1476199 RepID=UPI000BA7B23D|nr:flagellar motor protein MotB [Helicobacter sp. 12S02634-8]PAF48413.1 flagellar motor protein MotB [Helicobacter sp. 12S02634-8]
MAKKKKNAECPAGEKWAVPYADFLSLLLALFIALYAISATNKAKVEALKTEFIKIFSSVTKPETIQPVIPIPPNPGERTEETDGNKLSQSQQTSSSVAIENIAQLENMIEEGGVLEQVEQGVVLQLPANLLFKPAEANISSSDMMMYIKRIAQIIKKLPPQVNIDVRGYTDNTPLPKTSMFKDHYELAAMRAASVMKELIQDGISPDRISFSSYGKYKPLAPNDSVENRLKNNRVEIYLSTDPNNIKQIQSILDKHPQSKAPSN